jgi:hypothetical protein
VGLDHPQTVVTNGHPHLDPDPADESGAFIDQA